MISFVGSSLNCCAMPQIMKPPSKKNTMAKIVPLFTSQIITMED